MILSILQLPASNHAGLTFNRPPEIWGGFIGQARLHLANADLLGPLFQRFLLLSKGIY
jgi:hypothetical protein